MSLFRNIIIVGALALVVPIDGEGFADTADALVSSTAKAVGIATTVVSDTASFCERNTDVCREVAEDIRTVKTRTFTALETAETSRTVGTTQIVHRPDVRTTVLVRS